MLRMRLERKREQQKYDGDTRMLAH
jgi:hypothetical protein